MHVIVHVCRIQCSSAVIGLDDWILDVCWLGWTRGGDSSSFRVAAVTAHNTVVTCTSSSEGSVGSDGGGLQSSAAPPGHWGMSQYCCEVNCILYPVPLAVVQSLTALATQW